MTAPPDKQRASRLALILTLGGVVALGLVIWGLSLAVPAVSGVIAAEFAPGLGLKTAAMVAAGVSFVVLVALTLVAGDGLLGEIQFVIPGFFLFFLFFWLMTAWIF